MSEEFSVDSHGKIIVTPMNKDQDNNPQMTPMSTENEDPRTRAIIGAAMEAHRQLGHGFLEAVYQEALALKFAAQCIPFQREVPIAIRYKEQTLSCAYRADFVCFGDILVELKALAAVGGNEHSQVINYLKASGFRLGLLLNFGAARLQIKRIVFDSHLCSSVTSVDSAASHTKEIAHG